MELRETTIELYAAPGSSTFAPHVALIEANARFEAIPVSLAGGEQKTSGILDLNPMGRLPVLVVDGNAISEVIGTLAWIAHRFPDAGLLPFDDPALLGRAFATMSYYATTLAVALAQCLRTERFTLDQTAWPILKESGKANYRAGMERIESGLGGPWILGERYSVVDGYAFVLWRWGQRLGIDAAGFPRWQAHQDRMLDRHAVKRVIAFEAGPAADHERMIAAAAR